MRERLTSCLGVLVLLALAFAFCPAARRRRVNLRTVLGGLGLLLVFAALLLGTPVVRGFGAANSAVERLLGFTGQGARFVFGPLADNPSSFGYVFAFQVLPTILFFSALMSVLYHLGVLPWVIERGGRLLAKSLGVSGAESFSTVADVFVGQARSAARRPPVRAPHDAFRAQCLYDRGFCDHGGRRARGLCGHVVEPRTRVTPASLPSGSAIFLGSACAP